MSDLDPTDFAERIKRDTQRVLQYQDVLGPPMARAVIKALFDQIVKDLGITHPQWKRLMEYFLKDPLNNIPDNREDHVQARSSLTKHLVTSPIMTWVMLVKGLRFIRVKRFRIGLTLVHNDNSTTDHGMWVNLRAQYNIDDENESDTPYARVPTLTVREHGPASLPQATAFEDQRIHVPPPIDISAYSRNYPKAGSGSETGD